jgi:hypothetical protein
MSIRRGRPRTNTQSSISDNNALNKRRCNTHNHTRHVPSHMLPSVTRNISPISQQLDLESEIREIDRLLAVEHCLKSVNGSKIRTLREKRQQLHERLLKEIELELARINSPRVEQTGWEFKSTGKLPENLPSLVSISGPLPRWDPTSQSFGGGVFREEDPTLTAMNCELIELPKELMQEAGLRTEAVSLFARPRLRQQVGFICDYVIRRGKVGRIFGHPGTGKSTTTLYAAICLAQELHWNVLWVHITQDCMECIHMRPDGSKATAIMRRDVFESLIDRFHETVHPGNATGHLIVIDGIIEASDPLWSPRFSWVLADRNKRRLVLISSNGIQKRMKDEIRSRDIVCDFIQWSWTFEDYKAAMGFSGKLTDFHYSVDKYMDAAKSQEPAWVAKYFFAGGSARYMFSMPTDAVIEYLNDAVDDQKAAISRCRTNGAFCLGSVNGLFSLFSHGRYQIISEYAEARMMEQMGSEELINLSKHPILRSNESTIGSIFELFVYRTILESNKMTLRARSPPHVVWDLEGVTNENIPGLSQKTCPKDTLIWPRNRRELTIDGFILTETGRRYNKVRLIKFLQITVASKHDVDLSVLSRIMQQLNVQKAEFYFIVPLSRLAKFKPGTISNKFALRLFGWPCDTKAIKKQMQVLGMGGISESFAV